MLYCGGKCMSQSFTNQLGHIMKNVEWKKANCSMCALWYHLYKV